MTTEKSILDPLRIVAFDLLRTLIKHAGKSGTFKGMVTVLIDTEEKPVLVLGHAHGLPFEDGHAIAVLNPSAELQDRLHAGTTYTGGLLKEIIAGKCDAMVEVWLDAYKPKEVGESTLQKYVSRVPEKAKFAVR